MAKRVLIFSTAYLPLIGGAEMAIKEITDRLPEFEFDLITARLNRKLPEREKIGGVNIYRVGLGSFWDKILLAYSGARLAKRLHQKNSYDLIWAVMASFGGLAAKSFKKKNKNIPFLLTLQEGDDLKIVERKTWFIRRQFLTIFRLADYIQAISRYLAEWASGLGAVCPIKVVPNGVDIEKFKEYSIKFSLGENLNRQEKIIITTSRLVKKNGIADLIKAIAQLPAEFKLMIIGSGPEESNLKKLAANLKISDRINFVGLVINDDIPKYLAAADIFIRPSLSEGLGNSFLEAMAIGLPVIGTRVGGIPDFLRDEETGWFCEVNNPTSIAQKVKFITDPANNEMVTRVRIEAQALIAKNYDWTKIAEEMGSIFKFLL